MKIDYKKYNLTKQEFEIIKDYKSNPTDIELSIISSLWSEHCSYKSTKHLIKHFTQYKSKDVVSKMGDNAGIIRIDKEHYITVKIESHNHPTALDPFNGAATGVGGIIRDIIAMGADPIAIAHSVHIGNIDNNKNKKTASQYKTNINYLNNIIRGLSSYGNSIGIPNISSQVYFNSCFNNTPLVNAMCIGLIQGNSATSNNASGSGNIIVYLGSKTGLEGVNGAKFSSDKMQDSKSENTLKNIQVGNPFIGRVIIDAMKEINQSIDIIAMQDLGAAGIIGAISEMAYSGKCGINLYIDQVPQISNMRNMEVLLSESQERILLTINPLEYSKFENICKKYQLYYNKIAKISEGSYIRIFNKDIEVVKLDIKLLFTKKIMKSSYTSNVTKEDYKIFVKNYLENNNKVYNFSNLNSLKKLNIKNILSTILQNITLSNKNFIYEQFDYLIKNNTITEPTTENAEILKINSSSYISCITNSNSEECLINPYIGIQRIISKSIRDIISVGSRPICITNCLNYGYINNEYIYYQLEQTSNGMKDISEYFKIPIISGNVSLNNAMQDESILPTPIIGMLGHIRNKSSIRFRGFVDSNDLIILIHEDKKKHLYNSILSKVFSLTNEEYNYYNIYDINIDLQYEKDIMDTIYSGIENNIIKSINNIAEGGLATALSKCCISNSKGANISLNDNSLLECLFSENTTQLLISIEKTNLELFNKIAKNIKYKVIGHVTNDMNLKINEHIINLDTINHSLNSFQNRYVN